MLGPFLFTLYMQPLGDIIRSYGIEYHSYADDTQIYVYFDPADETDMLTTVSKLESCINDVKLFMCKNKLKLNDDKTEMILFSSRYTQPGLHLTLCRQ